MVLRFQCILICYNLGTKTMPFLIIETGQVPPQANLPHRTISHISWILLADIYRWTSVV